VPALYPIVVTSSSNLYPKVPAHAVLLWLAGVYNRQRERNENEKTNHCRKILLAYVLAQVVWLVVLTQYRLG